MTGDMKQIVFMFLLLYWNTQSAQSEIFNLRVAEGNGTSLICKHKGKVVWSKDRDGQRKTILTKDKNGEMVKYIGDPHNRYSLLDDFSLHINNVSLSDSGIYDCNINTTVNLIVTASVTPKSTVSSQSGSVEESKSTQSNTHTNITSTVTPKSTVSSQSGRVEESKSTQSTPHTNITSTVTPKSTVSSQSGRVEEPKSTQSNTHPNITSTDSIGVIVAVSCGVVCVALILLIYIKRKAAITNKEEKLNIYETVDDGDSTAQPAVPPQKQNDTIYYLAGDPNIVVLGQSKQIADQTYTLISEPKSKENLTDQRKDETLYSTIK